MLVNTIDIYNTYIIHCLMYMKVRKAKSYNGKAVYSRALNKLASGLFTEKISSANPWICNRGSKCESGL